MRFFGYDGLGRLASVTVTKLNGQALTTPLETDYTYDAVGNKAGEMLPNGVTTTYGYDDLNRLTSVTEKKGTTTLFSQTFILNDDGTRQSVHETELQSGGTTTVTTDTTWAYDAQDRLTGEFLTSTDTSRDYTNVFHYDLNGNRAKQEHTGPGTGPDETVTYTYNGDDQLTDQVAVSGGTTTTTHFDYDANGSQIDTKVNGTQTATYTYDVRNKMVGYSTAGTTASYVYDDAGNRVQETVNGTTTYYLTDTQNPTGYAQPIEVRPSQTGTPTASYILGDRALGQYVFNSNTQAYVLQYLQVDGHGSTRLLTDAIGAVVSTFDYDAFGTPLTSATDMTATPFLFGGDAVYDPASGLYLHGDGIRGRDGFHFVQEDSQGNGNNRDPLSLHKYLYANGSPVSRTDPTGRFSVGDVATTAGIIGVLGTITLGGIGGVLFHNGGIWSTVKGIAYGALGGSALGLAFYEGGPLRFGEALGTGLVYGAVYAVEDYIGQAAVNAIKAGSWSGVRNNIDARHVEQKAFAGFNFGAATVGYGQWLADQFDEDNGIAEASIVTLTTFVDDYFSSIGNGQSTVGNVISAGIDAAVQGVLTLYLANRVNFLESNAPEIVDQVKRPIENIINGMAKSVVNEVIGSLYIEGWNVFGQELVAWATS